ncbi:hypothetical protein ACFE04_030789 [Oxalis oulophora]
MALNKIDDPFSCLNIWDINPTTSSSQHDASIIGNTRIDWKETQDGHVIKAELPGLKKEEVKVEVENGNVLQISGERVKEVDEGNETWYRNERSVGKFTRRFKLPDGSKVDEIKAVIENGVLTVTVPKDHTKIKSIGVS